MNKETKQLNWFLTIMVIGAIAFALTSLVTKEADIPQPPIQIDTGVFPASERAVRILVDMSETCDISTEFAEALSDDILSNNETLMLGDLCISKAEAHILKSSPHALDEIRNKYQNNGGLSM